MLQRSERFIRLERADLYELVWSEPMSRLCGRFGVSDVALKKTCRKLEIPTPPRGYWAKRSAGKDVSKPELPEPSGLAAAGPYVIDLERTKDQRHALTAASLKAAGEIDAIHVKVPSVLRLPHPLTLATREVLNKTLASDGSINKGAMPGCLDVQVSKAQLGRALRVMDSLIKALEDRGCTVEITSEPEPGTRVNIQGQSLGIGITEVSMRVPHLLTREERRSSYYGQIPEYDYVGSGQLSLEIKGMGSLGRVRVRKRWADGKTQRVEDCVGSFIEGLAVAATVVAAWHKDKEEERQRWAVEQRRLEEEMERRRDEKARREQLLADAQSWSTAEMVRAYVRAVAKHQTREGQIKSDSEVGRWLAWASGVADDLDPLRRPGSPNRGL